MEGNVRDIQLRKLTERAKELKCVYQVLEALKDETADLAVILKSILDAIPPGYQHPTVCEARIILEGKNYAAADFVDTPWMQCAEIVIDNHVSGEIKVCYLQNVSENAQVFLPEEQKMLNTIADHLSRFIFHRRLKKTLELSQTSEPVAEPDGDSSLLYYESDEYWKWRYHVSEKIAGLLDMERLGVESIYIIGSTKTGKAGPGSDIDLLVHFRGNPGQENELKAWMEGWGLGLSELNFLKTGYETRGSLIDIHLITDEDIKTRTSFASKIGAVDDPAKLLRSRNL